MSRSRPYIAAALMVSLFAASHVLRLARQAQDSSHTSSLDAPAARHPKSVRSGRHQDVARKSVGEGKPLDDFPATLTNFYKGQWKLSPEPMDEKSVGPQEAIREVLDSDGSGSVELGLQNGKGSAFLRVRSYAIPEDRLAEFGGLSWMRLLLGHLVLRDGTYGYASADLHIPLVGIHVWHRGVAYMWDTKQRDHHRFLEQHLEDISSTSAANATLLAERILDHLEATPQELISDIAQRSLDSFGSSYVVPCDSANAVVEVLPLRMAPETKIAAGAARERFSKIVELRGIVRFPACMARLDLRFRSFAYEDYYSKAIHYVLVSVMAAFAQILLTMRLMEDASAQGSAFRLSPLAVAMQALCDAYLGILHIITAISIEAMFNAFAAAAFFEIALCGVFEMHLLVTAFRARAAAASHTTGEPLPPLQRHAGLMYSRFYFAIVVGLIILWQTGAAIQPLVFVLYSFWVPQIVQSAVDGRRPALSEKYVWGMTATRLFFPVYIYGCPVNFFGVRPSATFVLLLTTYQIGQAAIVTAQRRRGARWFLPQSFHPPMYDYSRVSEGPAAGQGEEEECVICMNTIESSEQRALTPCNHVYHRECDFAWLIGVCDALLNRPSAYPWCVFPQCLRQWLDQKNECPTCRQAPLPPLEPDSDSDMDLV